MKPATASTPTDTSVLVQRSFDAPIQLVWRSYTEPEIFARWCNGPPGWSMPLCEMDVRPGGQYRWRWRSDDGSIEFGFTGEFQEVGSETRLVHTQIYDPGNMGVPMGEKPTLITVEFREADGLTHVRTTISYSSKADRDTSYNTGMTEGMEMSYCQLDEVLKACS